MGSRPKHSDDEQYEPILRALGASVARREPWLHVGVSGRRHGWKLHVTTVPTQAERLLRIVVPHLLDGDHSFKIAADSGVLRRLNEGALGDTQVGKFCTIYPATDACATELIATLNSALATDFVGPRVNTDARIGPVLYTRYGSFQPNVRRDRLGLTYATITLPDGSTIRDAYSVPFAAPPGIDVPFQPTDDRLNHIAGGHLFADRLLLIDILKSGAKGRIFLAIDMSEQDNVRQVVLKEGRQYCLSDQHGRDMRDRLKHQHYVLSKIAALGIAPLPGHYFQSDGDGYLTVNYTPGHDYASLVSVPYRHLGKTERGQLLTCLSDLSCAVATLHAAGIIHRDVTPSNTRWSYDGGATLLDFELSFVLGAAQPVYHLGTPGYMSPQQQFASASPTPADDVYAFGCLASLLITSFDPRYVVGAPRTRRGIKLKQLSGAPSPLIDLLDRAMDRDPARRPEMRHICETLAHLRESDSRLDIYPDRPVLKRSRTSWPPKRILEKVAGGLLRAVVRDDKGLWLSNISPNDHQSISGQRLDYCRSAYRGVAGPVYLLARYTQANGAIPGASDTAAAAIDWLLAHVQTPDDQMPGLHFGEAGVAVAISEAVAAGLVNGGTWLREYLQEALQGPLDWPDLTHGAAGQGMAALICARVLREPYYASFAASAVDYLLSQQDPDGGWTLPRGQDVMSGERYTGFAHGAAGIIYFLSYYAARQGDASARESAIRGADWLVQTATPGPNEKGLVWPVKAGSSERWRWWCHGSAGIALCFLGLFRDIGDAQFAELARKALTALPLEQLGADLGQCHGVSGLGEVFLEASHVLNEPRWAHMASRIAQLLLDLSESGPGGTITWRVTAGTPPTGDLMIGAGGPAHLLLRKASSAGILGPPLL